VHNAGQQKISTKGEDLMFYERMKALCSNHETTITVVLKQLGLSSSKSTDWKNGTIPKGDILTKLAHHFGVTTDYLLGLSDNPSQTELEIPESLNNVMIAFHNGGLEDLTQEEVGRIAEFAQFVRSQRKNI